MATSKSESSAMDTLFSFELDTFPREEIENLKDDASDLVVIVDQLVDRSSVTTEHDSSDYDAVNLNMNKGDSDTGREDNSSITQTVGNEVSSDEFEETTYTVDNKMKPSALPQLIQIRPSKLTVKWNETGIVSVTNATHKRLVLYSVVDENHNLHMSPLAGVLFPQETAEISCRSSLENRIIGGSGVLIFTATEINSDTDVTGYDERKCQRTLDGYVKVGNPAETLRQAFEVHTFCHGVCQLSTKESLTYRVKPLNSQKPAPRRRHKSETSIGTDNPKSGIRPHPSHSAVSQQHSSESTNPSTNLGSEMTAEADDEMSNVQGGQHSAPMQTYNSAAGSAAEAAFGGKRVRINSKHISLYDQSVTVGEDSDQTQSQTDDEKLEWMRLAVEEESKIGNSLDRLHRRISVEEKTLNEHLEEIEILSTGTEALMHMLKAVDDEAKEYELLLFPRDHHLIIELKSEIQSYMVTYQGNLERMLRQQGTLYQLLDRHQSDLGHPGITSVLQSGISRILQPGSQRPNQDDTRGHTSARHSRPDCDEKNTGEQLPHTSEQSSTGHNISSNALMAKSGRARGNQKTAEKGPASLNTTSNAGQKEKHYTHTIKGRGTAQNLDDIATNQSHMEKEMTVMRGDLHNVDTHTEALLNMMTDLTSKVRSNRDGILAGVTGLQEKMKKAGFSLAEIEGEGDRNKATITLLQTNFNAHLDKIMSILSDTKHEQGKMKKQANQLNTGFRKAKTNILRISDGVYEEHKHITQLNLETNNKIDKLSAQQHLAERILKDMHKDMRIAMCKLKHLVCQDIVTILSL